MSGSFWNDNWDKVIGTVTGLTIGAVGYYAYARWVYRDPPVEGEEDVPAALLDEWQYYSWWDKIRKDDFPTVMRHPLSALASNAVVGWTARHAVNAATSGARSSLTASGVIRQHPWVDMILHEIPGAIEESVELEIPTEVFDMLWEFFDEDHDGYITRAEFVSKMKLLTTGTPDEIALALFMLLDKDKDGFVTVDEIMSVLDPLGAALHHALPALIGESRDVTVQLIIRQVYEQLEAVEGHAVEAERLIALLSSFKGLLPSSTPGSLLDSLLDDGIDRKAEFHRYAVRTGAEHVPCLDLRGFRKVLETLVRFDALTDAVMAMVLPVPEDPSPSVAAALKTLHDDVKLQVLDGDQELYTTIFAFLDADANGFITEQEFETFFQLLDSLKPAKEAEADYSWDLRRSGKAQMLASHRDSLGPMLAIVRSITNNRGMVSEASMIHFVDSIISFFAEYASAILEAATRPEVRHKQWKELVVSAMEGSERLTAAQFSAMFGPDLVSYLDQTLLSLGGQ